VVVGGWVCKRAGRSADGSVGGWVGGWANECVCSWVGGRMRWVGGRGVGVCEGWVDGCVAGR
jgi:hypothetical protein